ncbi:MAG: TlpA disulfide reductase family protein [Gemmatimonadota bacterium]|nr:TlpA disulfide reductase family protein [Gemmatimonadota bacterium]
MNAYSAALMVLIASLSLCLAATSAQSQPRAAIVTGEVHNAPSREIEFHHEPLLAPGPSQHHIVLDEQNRFALLLNIPKGTFVSGHDKDGRQHIPFFVEPGDSLHAVVTFAEVTEADPLAAVEPDSLHSAADEAPPSYSLTFSGRGAENNRFLAEFWPQHSAFEPDYALEAEEFVRQVKQRRRDEFALLAEGREQYALSPGFIDYMTAFINYNWADQTISYPLFSLDNGALVRRYISGIPDRRVVPPDYYDFLQEIPLMDEKAIGVREYRSFLENTLELEAKSDKPPRLADRYKLSGLGLSPAVHVQLDSMYDANNPPRLSQMIALSGLGLSPAAQAQLDSMYEDPKEISASEKATWLGLELSPAAQAQLDSYEDHRMRMAFSDMEDTTRTDTTGGSLTFHIPMARINEWYEYLNNRPLSARIDLSSFELSPAVQAQLDSMHQNRQPLKLSQRVDLAALNLSPAIQAQLDSIFAGPSFIIPRGGAERYDIAKQKLQGRVLYWFLAEELMDGIRHGYEAYVDARWQSFEESNPFPEYTEALQAEQNKLLTLQPGQPAPDFTLHDPDGQSVSLSQFKGKVVLMDFWASWCGPCITDLGTLRKIKEQVAAQPVVFLNVSLDENEGAWKRAIAKHQIKGVHVRSDGGATQAYNVSGIPRYYLVNPQGLIVENNLRVSSTDEVVAKIEEHLLRKTTGSVQ